MTDQNLRCQSAGDRSQSRALIGVKGCSGLPNAIRQPETLGASLHGLRENRARERRSASAGLKNAKDLHHQADELCLAISVSFFENSRQMASDREEADA